MLILKLKTFLKSLLFHVWAGFPKCSQKEIEQRYVVCVLCDKFNKQKGECGVCGCAINRRKIFLNKLAWADQKCPLDKWQAINRG